MEKLKIVVHLNGDHFTKCALLWSNNFARSDIRLANERSSSAVRSSETCELTLVLFKKEFQSY
jgi:hypothetical protein